MDRSAVGAGIFVVMMRLWSSLTDSVIVSTAFYSGWAGLGWAGLMKDDNGGEVSPVSTAQHSTPLD